MRKEKKKLKDLTDEEMNEICRKQRPQCTCDNTKLIKCPLYYGKCLKGFIQTLRLVNKEVEL